MTERLAHLILVLVAVLLAAAPVAAQDQLDQLKAQTVKITVTRSDKPVEYGSGVVLCQENKQAFVLTAHHVLAGKSSQPSGKNTLRLRRISKAEISFYGNSPPPVGKDVLTVFQVPGEDLLLLSFPLEQVLAPATLDTPAIVDPAAEEEDRPVVHAIGFWKDKAQSWAHRQGTLLPGGGRLIHHSGDIAEGFSGGPLFNEAGSLIGINIERVSGQAIGADVGSWYGEALAMDEILTAIDKWVPARCLKSASPLSELAYLTYRKAMQAVSIKRWSQAEELLAQAIEQQPLEGGSVRLAGLRYTPYLPLYHHGLAHYKLADRAESNFEAAEHYATAIRQWDRSEAQGEIKTNKRYRTLRRLKAKSYKELQRRSLSKTEEEQAAWAAAAEQAAEEKGAAEAAKAAAEEAEAAELAAKARAPAEAQTAEKAAVEAEVAARVQAALDAEKAEEAARQKAAVEAARSALRRVAGTVRPCARLRAEPSPSAVGLDCLKPGTAVTLLEQRDDWSRLRLEDRREGWMASRLLEPVE